MITLHNVEDLEVIPQRCLLVTGTASGHTESTQSNTYISVTTKNNYGQETFPEQHWPLCQGHFKALLILDPGLNHISFKAHGNFNANADADAAHVTETSSSDSDNQTKEIKLNYWPTNQTPPLYLAILIAKDSPLQIDCPPSKYGAISSAHSNLDAVIAKFRVTAYMWQALTAEDLRSKNLGRRSFRLEDEWSPDTLSRSYENPEHGEAARPTMKATAKVHFIRTERTVAELRDAQRAQQNPNASNRDELHEIFSDALKSHGGVFDPKCRPVVAGLILDSHYSPQQSMILGHAALGAHNPEGLSLGIFGSHLTYSWPRYMEEVAECLLDVRPPGNLVGNDNGECLTMWEACSVGQGAFLHEVGHAFSAPHTSGIMSRGYSQDWPKVFLPQTAYSGSRKQPGIVPVTDSTPNECRWDLRDALRFANLEHFWHHTDSVPVPSTSTTGPDINLSADEDFTVLKISCDSGIVQVIFNGESETMDKVPYKPNTSLTFTLDELEDRFDRSQPLQMEILLRNGKHSMINVWSLFSERSRIRVPGTNIVLQKQTIGKARVDQEDNYWRWAVMLTKRGNDGELYTARKIDLRVGCSLDGAVVYYRDQSRMNCGPRYTTYSDRDEFQMGGHQSRKLGLPSSAEIVKVQIATTEDAWQLDGLRMHLSNGKAMGALNKQYNGTIHDLVPMDGHRIIGFCGVSYKHGVCVEFGIMTAPKDIDLPDSMWDMPELNNTDGGTLDKNNKDKSSKGKNKVCSWQDARNASQTEESEISEDEDEGYDNEDQDW